MVHTRRCLPGWSPPGAAPEPPPSPQGSRSPPVLWGEVGGGLRGDVWGGTCSALRPERELSLERR